MKILIGLGNPGAQYARTRHNLGFRVLDRVAADLGLPGFPCRNEAALARTVVKEEELLLVKPMTCMNRSGMVVRRLRERRADWRPSDLLVIADDVNLDLGRLRMRPRGSCGGHNGLASIEEALGTCEYPRLRVGIGRPRAARPPAVVDDAGTTPRGKRNGIEDLVDYVLGEFSPAEEELLAKVVASAAQAVRDWIAHGLDYCRNRYNGLALTTLTGGET